MVAITIVVRRSESPSVINLSSNLCRAAMFTVSFSISRSAHACMFCFVFLVEQVLYCI